MLSYILTDDSSVRVEYKINQNQNQDFESRVIIMTVSGLGETERQMGLPEDRVYHYSLQDFIDSAQNNSLKLIRVTDSGEEIVSDNT